MEELAGTPDEWSGTYRYFTKAGRWQTAEMWSDEEVASRPDRVGHNGFVRRQAAHRCNKTSHAPGVFGGASRRDDGDLGPKTQAGRQAAGDACTRRRTDWAGTRRYGEKWRACASRQILRHDHTQKSVSVLKKKSYLFIGKRV